MPTHDNDRPAELRENAKAYKVGKRRKPANGIQNTLQHRLKEAFGFETFRPGQEAVVSRLLQGKSVAAVFPTGAGKSLCFQLPALYLDGLTLVISPLIALMKDQIDFLRAHGQPAARLDSTLSGPETLDVYEQLRRGTLKLLYVSPERLNNERFLQRMKGCTISMMVIDEAHCISEWGHNFRPDYLKLADLVQRLGVERVLALTATATPGVSADIRKAFAIAEDDLVQTGFHRPNLFLANQCVPEAGRIDALRQRLRAQPAGPTIVYVTLQKTAQQVAAALPGARAYHAGMKTDERHAVQQWFMDSDSAIVVATIAFGMGIDKSNIRYVYHYNLPKSLENYAQEIGRAGRDGEPARCEIFGDHDDLRTLENFVFGDTPGDAAIHGIVQEIKRQEAVFDLSHYELSGAHDARPLVVNTLMTYLQLAGIIESTGPFYNEYLFKHRRPSAQILDGYTGDPRDFLRGLFSYAKPGRTWLKLDLAELTQAGFPRERVVKALNHLEEQGDLELKVTGLRQGYRLLDPGFDADAMSKKLVRRFAQRESNDIRRLEQVKQLIDQPGCSTQYLLRYFGEHIDPCGHCSHCLGEEPAIRPGAACAKTPPPDREVIRAIQREKHPALAEPRQLARFLTGIASPATTRAKLTKDPRFGCMANVPFTELMALCE